jgi:hypothetical protein
MGESRAAPEPRYVVQGPDAIRGWLVVDTVGVFGVADSREERDAAQRRADELNRRDRQR